MLALNDPRWSELGYGYGQPGTNVPPLLRALRARPADPVAWSGLWELYHQGEVFSATFAAVPHVIHQALALPVELRARYWEFVGSTTVYDSAEPTYLQAGYDAARAEARAAILAALLSQPSSRSATQSQLFALMTLSGHPDLASALTSIGHGELELGCPSCSQYLLAQPSDDPKRGLDLMEPDF